MSVEDRQIAAIVPGRTFGEILIRHRRNDGRSQLHLALDAGISSRHLGFLEVGRSRPSAEMVVLLAGTLGLSLFERNELLLAAGFAPLPHAMPDEGVMAGGSELGTRAFDTAIAIAETRSILTATDLAKRFFRHIGIDHFMTGTLRRSASGWQIERDEVGEPAVGWLRHNEINRYREKDYLIEATAAATSGFFWNDIERHLLSAEQQRIIDEAGDFAIRNGFVMPVHMGDGSVRAFSSWSEHLETDIATRIAAGLVAAALIDALPKLGATATNAPVRLAGQQREILSRIAEGCSARKIARRLSRTESEVRRMIANATSAMGCASPGHAACRATALGLIST